MVFASSSLLILMLAGLQDPTATAAPPSPFIGAWNAKFSPEVLEICQKFNFPIPKASLALGADMKFVYTTNPAGKERKVVGTFTLTETGVSLAANPPMDGWPMQARMKEGNLLFDGLTFIMDQSAQVAGIWVRTTDKGQDSSIRFSFGKDGSYASRNQGGTTKGRYTIEGRTITLLYSEVDDVPVDPGMKLTITLAEDGLSFIVNGVKYMKLVGPLPPS